MTVSTTTSRNNYTGDGAQTIFAYTFPIIVDGDMAVYLDDVLQGAGYSVTGAGVPAGGTVVFGTAPAAAVAVTLSRNISAQQLVDYTPYGSFPADTHEGALDKLTMLHQQLLDAASRAITAPVSDDGTTDFHLPAYDASKGLMWDPTTKKLVNGSPTYVDFNSVAVTGGTISGVTLSSLAAALAIADGGTGATTVSGVHTNLAIPGNKNLIYNGAWILDQLNDGVLYTSVSGSNIQSVDGWSMGSNGAGVFKTRYVDDPDFTTVHALEITCTTADASIAAGDHYEIFTSIEGYDTADLLPGTASAKQITISFDMKFSVAGTYGVNIRNGALNRSYIGTVDQLVANTRESKIVTLTLDTTGTWIGMTSGVGLTMGITLAAGTTYQATAGTWQAGNYLTTSAQANFMSNIANIGYLGKIKLEEGAIETPWLAEDMDYAKLLAKAERYLETSAGGAGLPSASKTMVAVTGVIGVFPSWNFRSGKRSTPTMTYTYASGTGATFIATTGGFAQNNNHSTDSFFSWIANSRLS